jgi:ABC-type uncharacterized transport system permease subunit
MNVEIFAIVAIASYSAGTILLIRPLPQEKSRSMALSLAWGAVLFHSIYTALVAHQNAAFNISFFSMASLISLIIAVLLLLATLTKPVENLGILLFPLTALMLALELTLPEKQRVLDTHSWQMNAHIMASIIAFSLLNIAALQAILLAVQNQQLKSHPPKRYIQSMPPLQIMESLLFQMIAAGLFFLSIALVSGFIFLEDIFAQHLAHKTFLSIIAWLIFSSLLLGRRYYGWRGWTAIKWTLLGFLFLLLAYFGSKLVLEIILHR